MSTSLGGGRRLSIRVEGVVQGVGFRPFVHRLANELGIGGFVANDERGVVIEVEGAEAALSVFLRRLEAEAPPLARLERIEAAPLAARTEAAARFEIRESAGGSSPTAQIAPDTATCEACLAELADPGDRRYRYPFINCTSCGPRFTIVTGIPYDRPQTTMAAFEMCAACRAEYEDPADRRFHAQPIACPECGPRLRLLDASGEELDLEGDGNAVAGAGAALRGGLIVAVKGLGGFHLACRADDERAVVTLRERKRREEKPFALMCRDERAAAGLVELGAAELRILRSPERPIVIARRRPAAPVAESVAPANPDLGVMLPYTALHVLLLEEAGGDLVMTSGNAGDEPIAFADADALARLGPIADRFCTHDRPIRTRTDDSVVRAPDASAGEEAGRPMILRRSRGYVPGSLALPVAAPEPILACGAELKSAFCAARGPRAWPSHHIGDLKNYETLRSFTDGVAHFERLLELKPRLIVHDAHPDYLSTRFAIEREEAGARLIAVQHHHAHLAAALAEHGERGPAAGAIFDGTGYGDDGTAWGGELLVGGLVGYERAGFLLPVRLPGGDAAVREPWRMACAWLGTSSGFEPCPPPPRPLAALVEGADWEVVAGLCRSGVASPLTTSAGRLFDAVAAMCGIRTRVSYEGQAAIELEAAAALTGDRKGAYRVDLIDERPGPVIIDPRDALAAIAADLDAGAAAPAVAWGFHAGLAAATVEALARICDRRGLEAAVLSGGVFQNRLLLAAVAAGLRERGLRPIVPELMPANDGGIAYGQAAVAAAVASGMSESAPEPERLAEVLAMPVSQGKQERRLGEMTVAEVEQRAAELAATAAVPAMTAGLAAVARAWRELAAEMRRQDASIVADLDGDEVLARAPRLRLEPPGGSLL